MIHGNFCRVEIFHQLSIRIKLRFFFRFYFIWKLIKVIFGRGRSLSYFSQCQRYFALSFK